MKIESFFPDKYADLMRKDAVEFDRNRAYDVRWRFVNEDGRTDAAESAFFARQLEFIRPGLFEVQYPDLKGMQFVPVAANIPPGAVQHTYRTYDKRGEAQVSSNLTTRPPRVEVFGTESTSLINSVTDGYAYDIMEARAAMMAGAPLLTAKAMAARDLIARKVDEVILLGHPVNALKGLFTQSGAVTYTVTTGAGGGTTWESKTADEIVADIFGISHKIVADSLGVEIPDTLLLPLTSFNLISSKRMGDGSNMTIRQHALENSPYLKTIDWSHYLESHATAWTGKRMVCYKRDPGKLEAIVPISFEQMAPQQASFVVSTDCHARVGSTMLYFPKSQAYGDGI